MEENVKEFSKIHTYTTAKFKPEPFKNEENQALERFYGFGVASEIVFNFQKLNPKHPVKYAALLGIIRGMVPFIYRFIFSVNLDFSNKELLQVIGITLNCSFLYVTIYAFMITFLFDLKRKVYCMSQSALLLSPIKIQSLGEKKVLPTINIMSTHSLKCWSILRRVLLEYGKTYHTRLQVFMSFFVILIIIILLLVILMFVRIIQLPLVLIFCFFFELCTLMIMIFLMLYRGALVNEFFPQFQNIFDSLVVITQDLIRMKKVYIDSKIIPQSVIKKKSIEKLREMYGDAKGDIESEKCLEVLEDQKKCLQELQSELENDERNNPFTFFGVQITLVLIQSLSASIFTVLAAAGQYYLLTYLNIISA